MLRFDLGPQRSFGNPAIGAVRHIESATGLPAAARRYIAMPSALLRGVLLFTPPRRQ
jgi:hypothetical protein